MPNPKRFAEVRRLLEKHGFKWERTRGSHFIFKKVGQPQVVVPVHGGKVKPGYVREVEKRIAQAQEDDASRESEGD